MNPTASIVIGFTPFHLLPIKEVLRAIQGDVHVFHPMADNPCLDAERARLIFLGGCDDRRKARLRKYFDAGRSIDRIMRAAKVNLYVPHPFNPLSNFAFFHAKAGARYIYQDGILNYYDAMSPLKSLKWRTRQIAKAAVAALPYTIYSGHLSGIDRLQVDGGFFTHPLLIVRRDRFPALRQIAFTPSLRSGPLEGTLFLDQPIEEILEHRLAANLRNRTLDYINGLGGTVYYKPHYAQKRAASSSDAWLSLDAVLDALPAEWVVPQLGVSNVVSFTSSALTNVATTNPEVRCHATGAHLVRISIEGRSTTLAELFSALGTEIVRLI